MDIERISILPLERLAVRICKSAAAPSVAGANAAIASLKLRTRGKLVEDAVALAIEKG
jgi:hypothetical protein